MELDGVMKQWRMRSASAALAGLLIAAFSAAVASATPSLLIDADSGQVISEDQAAANWYPASLTKLMTVYVALSAVRDGRLTMDTPMVMSVRAARMPPSKMGFRPGAEVTLDNALKMLMVKSPNDVAVLVAEGVSGSIEAFADEMNAAAARLGLRESHFVNPNGLPDARQVSSARDMAMIARALLREFPQENDIYGIGALLLGNQIIKGHNGLIGHYPGADGMKTGFTCAAGFNVVASATRNGRRLIAVVLGASSARGRTEEAAAMFDRGFSSGGAGGGSLESLASPGVGPAPDMHQDICSRRNRSAVAAAEEEEVSTPSFGILGALFGAPGLTRHVALSETVDFTPVPVFIGPKPGWTGPVLAARAAGAPVVAAKAAPADLSAYAADKPQPLDAAPAAPGADPDLTAPVVLQGAVQTPDVKALKSAAKTKAAHAAAKPKAKRKAIVAKKIAPPENGAVQ
jgi:D-alanyl-D-alanine carboxypeptidase